MTLDNLRTALRHPQPWAALDELIRAEQAAGRKVQDIHDELRALVEPVRAVDNPPELADDAMMDTLDALAGNCREESCYRDLPNETLPREEEIAKLPRWARVAFAARCARRVERLFRFYWPNAPKEYTATISNAIRISESSAGRARASEHAETIAEAVDQVIGLAESVAFDGSELNQSFLGSIAACSLYAAKSVCSTNTTPVLQDSSITASDSEARLVEAAQVHAQEGASLVADVTPFIRHDFDHILRVAEQNNWTDQSAVSPEIFGPLWSSDPPAGWPQPANVPNQSDIPVSLFIQESLSSVICVDEIVNIFNTLNQYHIARTGVRLTLEGDIHTLLTTLMPAQV